MCLEAVQADFLQRNLLESLTVQLDRPEAIDADGFVRGLSRRFPPRPLRWNLCSAVGRRCKSRRSSFAARLELRWPTQPALRFWARLSKTDSLLRTSVAQRWRRGPHRATVPVCVQPAGAHLTRRTAGRREGAARPQHPRAFRRRGAPCRRSWRSNPARPTALPRTRRTTGPASSGGTISLGATHTHPLALL